MSVITLDPRIKVHGLVDRMAKKYHFAPLEEGPTSSATGSTAERLIHRNLVLMALSELLDKNHLIMGEPGWGKTTGAKVVASLFSGLPYDLYDSIEIRGHPQKFEEKIVARPDYGKLAKGEESVRWQGSFGADVLIVDEVARLALDSQDVILQGIDTGRWVYLNDSIYEGKKPSFFTMNEKDGDRENGLLPALKDRIDVVTEERYFSTMVVFDLKNAKKAVEVELWNQEFTQRALDALRKDFADYKRVLGEKRPINGHINREEKQRIQEKIDALELDNDATLFLQAFMAEINFSRQYGSKRAADPRSPDTHDQIYAGVNVHHTFSPRSAMTAIDYAKALAWFMGEKTPTLDHVRYVLPHVFALKAGFHEDYVDKHANDVRVDSLTLHLAKQLVEDVHGRYTLAIQPIKNIIAGIQAGTADESNPEFTGKLDPKKYDHPLMIDLLSAYKEGEKRAFYDRGDE